MKRGCLVTIGSFDGVHLGHRALIERTCSEARRRKLRPTALTFSVPPKMILDAAHTLRLLSDPREKEMLLKSYGIDDVVTLKFDQKISSLKPFAFVKTILIEKLRAKGVVVGADFRFGAQRSAGVHELVRWGQEFEIPVWVIPAVKASRQVISSSVIRHLLETQNLKKANRLLGHPYVIAGRVVTGRQVGRELGFRTANIRTEVGKVLPRGVFAIRAMLAQRPDESYAGVCNIGTRPTFGKGEVSVEAHLFDMNRNMVGQTLIVELLQFLRSEKTFSSFAALQRQIALDVKKAKKFTTSLRTFP